MGILPHFLTHGAPLRALRARELRYNYFRIQIIIIKNRIKIDKAERVRAKTKKKKARKNIVRIYEEKKERSEKLHTSDERT